MCGTINTPDEFIIIESEKEHKYSRIVNDNNKLTGKVDDGKDNKRENVCNGDNNDKNTSGTNNCIGDNTNNAVDKSGDNNNNINGNIPIIGRLGESDILLGIGNYYVDKKFNLYRRIDTNVIVPISKYGPIIHLQFLAFMILMTIICANKSGDKFALFGFLGLSSFMVGVFMCIIPFCARERYLIGYKPKSNPDEEFEWCGLFYGERIKLFFHRMINSLVLSACGVNLAFIIFGSLTYYVYNLA